MNTVLIEKPENKGLDKAKREKWPSYTVPMKHHKKPLSMKQREILHLVRLYMKAKSYNVKSYIYAEIMRIEDPLGYSLLYND